MKHLLTLTALLISSLAMGQMPYNPDSNGDDLIGATDLISVLGLYNTLMVDSSLTCSYEGTEFESWFGGLFDGTLTLDSLYVEYLYVDSVETFLPGCPNPVMIETVLDRSYVLTSEFYDFSSHDYWFSTSSYLGYNRTARFEFYPDGNYRLYCTDAEISEFTNYGQTSNWNSAVPDCCNFNAQLPFLESWSLNENGIQVDWSSNDWVANCEHFRLITYWSEAE